MLNQGQGTYPQLAGSFYNSQQMMPHDNGRNAQQVPTFFGGLQNMMSASTAMQNYQGIPLGQSILNTQALAAQRYADARGHVLSGIGTGLTALGAVGTVGTMLGGSSLGTVGGILGGLASAPMALATMAVGGIVHGYNKRMDAMRDMRNAMEGTRLGYGLADPVTGNLSNSAAYQLSKMMENSTRGAGFHGSELKTVMGQASGLGMLNGMQSLGEVTKKVTDLAKASREIVMLGEGISMTDAMHLQKLTQDMGISTAKFRGTNIGKNLVMAARASSMSLDQAAQVGGMGAATYQQMGLGAAAGMNAAFHTSIAAQGLVGAGAFSQRQLAALGGQQGIAQSLLAGQAGTMGRMADALVMGTVKLGEDGQFRIDRSMLDRFVTGKVSSEELIERGKNIGKDMSKGQRSKLLESLQFAMPELKEQMTDMLSSEEKMAIQARGVLELQKNTGLSMRRAAQAYFQDAGQAEAFLGYANNFDASRAEMNRQNNIAQQENMLRYAGMAKSSGVISRTARGFVHGVSSVVDGLMSPFEAIGDYVAGGTARDSTRSMKALSDILGIKDYGSPTLGLLEKDSSGRTLLDYSTRPRSTKEDEYSGYGSYYDRAVSYLFTGGSAGRQAYLDKIGYSEGLNRFMGGGLGGKLTEYHEGDYNPLRQIGDALGIEDIFGGGDNLLLQHARINEEANKLKRIMAENTSFDYSDAGTKRAYKNILARIREVSIKAAKGEGSGYAGGANAADLEVSSLMRYAGNNLSDKQKEAALAQAMRYARTAGSDLGVGFNSLMQRTSNVLGMSPLDSVDGQLDTIAFRGGATFKSEGLSEAVRASGISNEDLNKLLTSFRDNGDLLAGEGAGVDSLRFILGTSGIDADKYRSRMGGIRSLIESVKKGRVTRITKNSDGESVTLEQSLQDAENSGARLGDISAGTALNLSRAADQKQLDEYNKRIVANLGAGASGLIRELSSRRTITDQAELTRMAVDEAVKSKLSSGKQEITDTELQANVISTRARYTRDAADLENSLKVAEMDFRADPGNEAKRRKVEETKKALKAAKTRVADLDVSIKNKRGYEYDRLREEIIRASVEKEVSDDGTAIIDSFKNSRKSLGDYTSLTDLLTDIGDGDQNKTDALLKLAKGSEGSSLKFKFKDFKAKTAGMSGSALKSAEDAMIQEIAQAAARSRQSATSSGKDQSASLGKLMENISLGLDEFKKAMTNIANLTATNGTVTISAPQLKGENK